MSLSLVPERKRQTVTVLVDSALRERLAHAAHQNDRSLGAEVCVALREHLERADDETGEHE